MLAYAFHALNTQAEEKYDAEDFDFVDDLFAVILTNGIARQLKQGLGRDYIIRTENLNSPKGKICLSDTFKQRAMQSNVTICQVDDYIENTYMNQILKTTAMLLLHSNDVKKENKRKLKRVLLYFAGVDQVDCKRIRWSNIQYNRNNKQYKMLMNICYLIIEGMLVSDKEGKYKLNQYVDDQKMNVLYEKFILNYYRRHYPNIKATASQIDWNTEDNVIDLLPRMKSDVMLEYAGKTFIIDAKYYNSSLQTGQYGKQTIHSHNLYQIFTYVKNRDVHSDGSVTGMLLYANTEGENPDMDYRMNGNKISVKTLDLNCSFGQVAKQLDDIVSVWADENSLEIKKIG